MRPRVTIIIPTYNRARLVARAIDSALGQGYPNLDVIVVDDGSTDDTQAVLRAYETNQRVRLLRHEHNRGVNAAINTALDQLADETAYFALLGSDDALLPGAVATLVAVFEADGLDFSQVFGWCRDMHTGSPTGGMSHLPQREGLVTYEDALAGRFTGDFWHLARRDLLDGLRFEARGNGKMSSVWWPLLRHRPAWLSPSVVLDVDRSGADRLSRISYTRERAARRMWAYHAFIDAVGRDLRVRYPGSYARRLAELAKWAALAGNGRLARAASREALRIAPSRRAMVVTLYSLAPAPLLRRAAESTRNRRLRASRR